jgi:hypothetical protein
MPSSVSRSFFLAAILGSVVIMPIPSRALADDAARISQLESAIQQLRMRIDEQNRRIMRLEEELRVRSSGPPVGTIPGRHEGRTSAAATTRQPWHSPKSWEQLSKGMSEARVRGILGLPTSIESLGELKTLFYRGEVVGSGSLSGHVNLRNDQVVAVNKPAFGQ